MSIESMMLSSHLILCSPLFLLHSTFPELAIRIFSSESVLLIRWPKYWSFSISPSNESLGLILFRIYLISLLTKGLSRVIFSTTVWKHQFFSAQSSLWSNSHLYATTGRIIALSIWTLVGRVMSPLFNMQSWFGIALLPQGMHLFISLISPSTVIFKAPQNKMCHRSHYFRCYLPWGDRTRCHICIH